MIYTCTLNPSVDYYIHITEIDQEDVTRSTSERFDVGGKGLNVSRVLKRLNEESTALSFVGGFSGHFIEEYMKSQNINCKFIPITENTRINVKNKGEVKLDVSGSGPTISQSQYNQLLDQVKKLKNDDWFVVSGSVPKGLPSDVYAQLSKLCNEQNIPFIVDTNNQHLMQSLQYNPLLIKPNHEELKDIFGIECDTIEEYIQCAKQLLTRGAQNVIVSLGAKGALFVNEMHSVQIKNLKRKVINTVGCGDSMVAGFLYEFSKSNDALNAFKFACAVGNAKAFYDYDLDLDQVLEIYNELEVIDLEQ